MMGGLEKLSLLNSEMPGGTAMNDPEPQGEVPKREERSLRQWQAKLRKWMQIVVSLTGVLFFLVSAWQVNRILRSINETGQYDRGREPEVKASLDRHMLYTMAGLECYALQRRYHQADIALLSRLWIKYLGFFTGMILAVIGASFILGKLQESDTTLTGKLQAFEFSLISASPGLVMVLLGAMLMMTAILELIEDQNEVQTQYWPQADRECRVLTGDEELRLPRDLHAEKAQ